MESISRISSMLETARDLTLEAARDASNSRKPYSTPLPTSQLRKLLDSRNDREVLEGLRRVISLSYCSPSTPQSSALFSSVLKNIASPSLPVKKLVYIYLLQHADSEPDTALLAINTIQKTLSSPDPHLRALALRVMSGIRVPVIAQIVSLGIKKGIADMSPLVRRAAALAIPKCWRLDPSSAPQLLEYLSALLGDKQYFVMSASILAFMEVCPERIDMIHPHYHSLIRKLVDMDEWGQLATLRLMTRYARLCFPRKTKLVKSASKSADSKSFYDDEVPETPDGPNSDPGEEISILDPDLELLLKACQNLLFSRNSAIIVAVVRVYLHLGTPSYLQTTIGPLVSLLRGPTDTQQIALYNIVQIALGYPQPFVKYATHFLIRTKDTPQIWRLKLEVLSIIFPFSPRHLQSLILNELSYFSHSQDSTWVRESIQTIGRCAQSTSDTITSSRCLKLLLSYIDVPNNSVLVSESLTLVRQLIQASPSSHTTTITRLAKNLDSTANEQARASIIWLVGEYTAGTDGGGRGNIAADVLRILTKGFAEESEDVKRQIVLLAAKVYLHYLNGLRTEPEEDGNHKMADDTSKSPDTHSAAINDSYGMSHPYGGEGSLLATMHPITQLWHHILTLTRYDTSYDLRDRTRLYRALLPDPTTMSQTAIASSASVQLASLLLLAPKPVPRIPSPSANRAAFVLGSASLVIGEDIGVREYEALPDWVEEGREPDARLRAEDAGSKTGTESKAVPASERLPDTQIGGKAGNKVGDSKTKGKTLNDWLDEGDREEEEDEVDEEEIETEDETEGSTEEESSEASSEKESSDDDDDVNTNLVR